MKNEYQKYYFVVMIFYFIFVNCVQLKNSETEDEDSEMLFPKGGRWQKVRKDSAASEASGDYGPSGSVNYRTGGSVTYSEDSRCTFSIYNLSNNFKNL